MHLHVDVHAPAIDVHPMHTVDVCPPADGADVILAPVPGPHGPPGPEGPEGPPGIPGTGPSWWFGHGPPDTIPGSKPGDRYLDEDTGDIYQLGD